MIIICNISHRFTLFPMEKCIVRYAIVLSYLLCLMLQGCSQPMGFYDPNMDFGSIHTVAVMPFANLTDQNKAHERVRDVFINALLASSPIYVLPPGEVARGISRTQVAESASPSVEDAQKLGATLGVDAIITGVVKEYGEVRSGTAQANVIAVSLRMMEVQTGKVVWAASASKGGINTKDRLLGGGGQPMNQVTEEAVRELVNQLFH